MDDAARLDCRRPYPGDQRANPRGGLCRAAPRRARGAAANARPPQIQPPDGRRERDRRSRVSPARFLSARPSNQRVLFMPVTVLYPEARQQPDDLERAIFGRDVKVVKRDTGALSELSDAD